MKIYNLNEKVLFSSGKPVKRHFLNAKGFHAALICLKAGVEIPAHEEDYGVLLTVLQGRGVFTGCNGQFALEKNQAVYMKANETRGIRAETDLVVLGVQDRAKKIAQQDDDEKKIEADGKEGR